MDGPTTLFVAGFMLLILAVGYGFGLDSKKRAQEFHIKKTMLQITTKKIDPLIKRMSMQDSLISDWNFSQKTIAARCERLETSKNERDEDIKALYNFSTQNIQAIKQLEGQRINLEMQPIELIIRDGGKLPATKGPAGTQSKFVKLNKKVKELSR